MQRNKPWMDTDQYIEDYYEELLYRQALEYEWEQWEMEQLKNEKGRIHTDLKPENKEDESNSEYQPLHFPGID